mmetsp:Transcript_91714/g.275325  ORF Transcript_91714/g.275325 Transcript_91714/m.275325 type:complete len:215 (-) Transcript_91714:228-872(-)
MSLHGVWVGINCSRGLLQCRLPITLRGLLLRSCAMCLILISFLSGRCGGLQVPFLSLVLLLLLVLLAATFRLLDKILAQRPQPVHVAPKMFGGFLLVAPPLCNLLGVHHDSLQLRLKITPFKPGPGCGADRVKHLLPEPFEERLCGVLHVARIRHRLPPLPEAVEVARDRVWIVRLIIKVSLAVVLVVPRRRLRRLRAQGPPAVRHGRRAAACG